jgi:large subunit ribosomal protein L25
MSKNVEIQAQSRKDEGKGASRRLRRLHDKVPGIVYGGDAEPVMVSLEMRELRKALETEAFYSQVLTLKMDGKEQQAVLRDLQRHPASGFPAHADFLRVSKSQKLTMVVPLHFANEEACVGVKKQGGEIRRNVSEVEVSCLPQDLPEFIAVDMAAVELDQIIHLSDLQLPAGVEIPQLALGEDHNQPVVAVHTPKVRADDSDDEEGGAQSEGDESSEG